MRPRLRRDSVYVRTGDGTYFANGTTAFTVRNTALYELVDRLAPFLDGGHTLRQIVDGLTDDRRRAVVDLIEFLHGRGIVVDAERDEPHRLSATVLEVYARQIAFIDYQRRSAARAFERFRDANVALVGSGMTLVALARAELAAGRRIVRMFVTQECAIDDDDLRAMPGHATVGDAEQRVEVQRIDSEAALLAAVEGRDAVLHVSDRPMAVRARTLARFAAAHGCVLLQGLILGDDAWLGPLLTPQDDSAAWESAWLRLWSARGPERDPTRFVALGDERDGPISDLCVGPTASVVANTLSFELFQHQTGVAEPRTHGAVLKIDLETLGTSVHSFAPHAGALADGGPDGSEALRSTVERNMRHGAIDPQRFEAAVTAGIDGELGMFRSIDERDLRQLPLNVTAVEVAVAPAGSKARAPTMVCGVGDSPGQARVNAMLEACRLYAAATPDPARLTGERNAARAWGIDLADDRAVTVDVHAAFPAWRDPSIGSVGLRGVGAGWTWEHAVAEGLASHAVTLAGGTITRQDGPALPAIALGDAGPPRDAYLAMIAGFDAQVSVFDAGTWLGLSAVAVLVADREQEATLWSTGGSVAGAAASGLRTAVQWLQSRHAGEPAYLPAPGPMLSPGRRTSSSATRADVELAPASAVRRAVAELARSGMRPIVVPLDHDPGLAALNPYVVTVVLTDG